MRPRHGLQPWLVQETGFTGPLLDAGKAAQHDVVIDDAAPGCEKPVC